MILALLVAVALLPAHIEPQSPFPHIFEQAPTIESVAPGVEYGDYQLLTSIGLLSIHVVAAGVGVAHSTELRGAAEHVRR